MSLLETPCTLCRYASAAWLKFNNPVAYEGSASDNFPIVKYCTVPCMFVCGLGAHYHKQEGGD